MSEPWRSLLIVYLVLSASASVTCFVTYGWDKWRATRGGRRVPERVLHRLELLGGWPGALLARSLFRHKTRKRSYRTAFSAIVLLHLALLGVLVYLGVTR